MFKVISIIFITLPISTYFPCMFKYDKKEYLKKLGMTPYINIHSFKYFGGAPQFTLKRQERSSNLISIFNPIIPNT